MILDVYLVRDTDYNTVKAFASELKAKNFKNHNPKSEMERIELDIPLAAMEIHRVTSTEKRKKIIKEVKTLKQIQDEHIEHVYVTVCGSNLRKAAKILDINLAILKMELNRIIEA